MPEMTDDAVLERLRVALDTGMDEVRTKKQAHFEAFSGQRRAPEDLDAISNAAYTMRSKYGDAEDLYAAWAYAPVPVERVVSYILADIHLDEAQAHWEPRFATSDPHDVAALEMLLALRMPTHALRRR